MSTSVSIKDIVEEMDMQMEEYLAFLNVNTGRIVSLFEEDLHTAEEEEPMDAMEGLQDWEKDVLKLAYDIVDHPMKYKQLPSKYEIHEYEMIEEFCLNIQDPDARENLLILIKGRGAFRRFKDRINELGIEEEWYTFREEQYRKIAVEWCEANQLSYTE
ncbi:UPF0158 family protein [Halobacillus hunanensis]|uniref:UPF0158 family protein n=1 Tax=Halobacillus hunanensis TaxID=578214 RepID=UPI0009A668B8|nr:UPF0158 family protein [Halobacillus hunanensis]